MKSSLHRKLVIIFFLSIPFLSSLISTLHIIRFFSLGNPNWMSLVLAVTFEIGSLASLMSFSVLDKIKKGPIYFIFGLLFIMQLIGNIYFSFDYVSQKVLQDPNWLLTFKELIGFIIGENPDSSLIKFILSLVIAVPIPLISISFTKSLVDYLESPKEEVKEESHKVEILEEVKEEESIELKEKEPIIEETPIIENNIEEVKETIKEEPIIEEPKINKEEIPSKEIKKGGISVAVFPNNKN